MAYDFFPLPVSLNFPDVIAAGKNFKEDPAEGAHAGLHVAAYALGLFHKHQAGFKAAATSPEIEAKLAEVQAGVDTIHAKLSGEGLTSAAMSWEDIKPWAKKFLELLLLVFA